ncbi:MAG TPA: hypothetical protein PKU83_03965 [Chryseolinea sp.]|nr:hypothetical protein [Chryseolinea sp.]
MRLGQLARKISIRQTDIVDFLAKSDVVISSESNARVEDEHVKFILAHFAPSFLEEKIESNEVLLPEEKSEEIVEVSVPSPIVEEAEVIQNIEIVEVASSSTEDQKEEKVEVIKAPKVDLPGLKVIGKIDLPESKKKEVLPAEESEKVEVAAPNSEVNAKPRPQRNRNTDHRNRERNNRSVNPIAVQRERDARAAKRKEEKTQLKKRRDAQNTIRKE